MTWAHMLALCEGNPPVAGEAITMLMTPESEVVSNIWYFKIDTSSKRNILTVCVNAFYMGRWRQHYLFSLHPYGTKIKYQCIV